mgnify:CR=1 FL=1
MPCAGIPAIVHAADLLYRREFAERNTLRFPWMHSSSVSYLMRGLFKSRFSLYLWYGRKERLGCPPGFHFRLNFISCFHLFLMIYPQSLSAFGAQKSGNNDPGKIQYVCLTANSRHSRSMGRCPVKQKSQQQPAFMAQQYY